MSVTVKLSQPVVAHGDEVSEITLREPVPADTMDLGMPYVIDLSGGDAAIAFKPSVIAKYVVRLGGVPMSTVKALSLADWQTLQAEVQGFFGRSADAAPTNS